MAHSEEEIEIDFVEVSRDLKKYVLGRGGCVIDEIGRKSGARVSTGSTDEEGFTVIGNDRQRACAKRLILEKVREIQKRKSEEAPPGEFVEVPKEYKGLVFGKHGKNLQDISRHTGAQVIRKDGEVYITSGTEQQREQAKLQIKVKIAGARLGGVENKFNKFCVYIDGWNLPENCKLKLEEVVQGDRMVIPESDTQYRLKPAESYGQQQNSSLADDPTCLSKLSCDALESLRKIKQEMKTKDYLQADMWCHFGKNVIRGPNKVEADEQRWTIEEASKKFKSQIEGTCWKTALKSGVSLNEKILERHVCSETPEEYVDYAARYDLAFVTPCSHQVICKVWVTKKNVGKKLEDIPVPLSDVKNILEGVHFEDEVTRSRCRGWLVLPSRKYLQADILFRGGEFDCRLMIRGRTDEALVTDYVPKEEERKVLANYLSELTLTDEDDSGLCLPEGKIPEGFHLTYQRCSRRSVYEISPGFTVILSKESSWRSDGLTEERRESTDFHLHCREWDDLLNSGDWEPEKITEKLPEFFLFVKKVQGIVREKTVPPEILARGLVAVEAYNKALSDGITFVKRVPIMLIGQDRAGKTSLKKSLKGICFDPNEDSTVGIVVDPSHFEVSAEMWKTGEMDQNQDSDTAVTFENQTARCMVNRLKTERKSTKVNTAPEESPSSFDSETRKMEGDPRRPDPSVRAENVQTNEYLPTTSKRQIPHVSSDPTEQSQEDVNYSYPDVPDEVASKTETLLQGDLEVNGEEIYSAMWDFAGQSVYYVTHPLFLTTRGIYCLVYDLSLNPQDKAKPVVKQGVYEESQESFNLKTNMDYLEFWMESVASLASSQEERPSPEERKPKMSKKLPPVFLVCTHADTPYDGRDPKGLARKIFGSLKRKPYGVHLSGVFFVDNTSLSIKKTECSEVQRLRKAVLDVAKTLPHIKEAIPIKLVKFEKELQAEKEKGNKHISLEAARKIAENVCSIDEEIEFETLMSYLHDLRSLIHFDDTAMLNKLVFLDPQWLVDVFKKVITVKPFDCEDMEFLELWSKLEEEGILDEELLAHAWEPLFENKETSESLIGIMERFSLLCRWPLDATSSNKSYLVPSMLKSHPPDDILKLVASAKIPSLFLKFENGLVPAGFFPRFVLHFLQWGKEEFLRPVNPQMFNNFARFFTTKDDCSVILMCHSSSVEVVVHGGDLSLRTSDDVSSRADFTNDTTGVTCARDVQRQLRLLLESMRNEFPWLRNMKYEMSVICPSCCRGMVVNYCKTHPKEECKQERCLHFLNLSELYNAKGSFICTKSASAKNIKVQVEQFSPWFASPGQQKLNPATSTGKREEVAVQGDPENSAKALNVTLLASEWGSSMGGLSTINRTLAILLAKNTRVDVTLLVPQDSCREEDKRAAAEHNIAIREAPSLSGYDRLDWLSFPPDNLAIDIIIGHGAKLGKQAQVIRRSHDCKWAQVVHTAPEELGMHKDYPRAIAKGEKKKNIEVDLCKLADLVVTVGPKLTEEYSSYLRYCEKDQDIIQLTPGIFQEFTTVKQAAWDGEKFKVLTFGRGDREDFSLKGYDIAAKAVTGLKDISYCLVFVGAPSGREEEVKRNLLRCGISENQLKVRGFVQGKENLKELLCEVDLAILPSKTEGFGLTALEALSAGLPILVSGNSGFAQALRDLPSGKSFVVESKDPKELAKAIASVRQKGRAERLEEIQALRTSYEEKYSWEDQCGALVEKLRSMTLKCS